MANIIPPVTLDMVRCGFKPQGIKPADKQILNKYVNLSRNLHNMKDPSYKSRVTTLIATGAGQAITAAITALDSIPINAMTIAWQAVLGVFNGLSVYRLFPDFKTIRGLKKNLKEIMPEVQRIINEANKNTPSKVN